MTKHLFLTAMATAVAMSLAWAGQNTSQATGQAVKPSGNLVIPVTATAPSNAKLMFTNYCAPCHGADGKGHGPAAASLKTQPIDLTLLSQNNHGKFPSAHVVTVLQFGSEMPAHGSAQMPIWGPILGNMNQGNKQDKQLRIGNLTRYIETIQVK